MNISISTALTRRGYKIVRDARSILIAEKGHVRVILIMGNNGKKHFLEVSTWESHRKGTRKHIEGSVMQLLKYIEVEKLWEKRNIV